MRWHRYRRWTSSALASIEDVDPQQDAVRVRLAHANGDSREISGRLLVAADGASSAVRAMLGICAKKTAYGQRAIIGNLLPERAIGNAAYERFTERGPIAMLPIAEGRAAFVWIVGDEDADELLSLDDDDFAARLQDAFGLRLGRFSKMGKRSSYPLSLSKALRLTAERGVVVGNAAHGLHPVAAQGFNLGMRDVAALCDCIADARLSDGDDPGAEAVLSRYADWRSADQARLVGITDGLVKLFGDSSRPARLLRNVGMLGFDVIPGVRSLFARQMMGLSGRLPRLPRGVPLR